MRKAKTDFRQVHADGIGGEKAMKDRAWLLKMFSDLAQLRCFAKII